MEAEDGRGGRRAEEEETAPSLCTLSREAHMNGRWRCRGGGRRVGEGKSNSQTF